MACVRFDDDEYPEHFSSPYIANPPTVLIIGAGVGGLTLAALLHKGNIPFELFDSVPEPKPI
ncbi:hypothetical protein BGZ94_004326, partial [Podila epigama]